MSDTAGRARVESLLAETGWVRALARRMCADPGTADDLAQDTFVAALEHPPREGTARAWLATVVANMARARVRSGASREHRERGHARGEALEPAADVVARAELSRKLVEHVLALAEPYRSTVLSRFFDGLSAEEIARRDGVNASTVRTRLERGIARLRERLARERGTGWMHALVPLAHGGAGGATQAIGIGVLSMTTATKLGLAIAGVIGVVWLALPRARDAERTELVGPSPVGERALAHRADRERDDEREALIAGDPTTSTPPEAAPARASAPAAAAEEEIPPGTIAGLVLRGREPVSGGTIWFWPGHWRPLPDDPVTRVGPTVEGAVQEVEIGGNGRFKIAPLAAGWYSLGVDLGTGVAVETYVKVDAESPGRSLVIVLGSASLAGRVYDDEGAPVAGASIRVSGEGSRVTFDHHARTDEHGAYRLRDLAPGSCWISLDREGQRGPGAKLDDMRRLTPPLADGEQRTVDFGSPERAIRWTGRIVARSGAPVELGGRLGWSHVATRAYSEVDLRPGKPFDLRLRPGEYQLQVTLTTSDAGHGTGYFPLGKHEVGTGDLSRDLELAGTRIEGRVIGWDPADAPRGELVSLHWVDGRGEQTVSVAKDGRFCFDGVPAGEWIFRAHPLAIAGAEPRLSVREGDVELPLELRLERP